MDISLAIMGEVTMTQNKEQRTIITRDLFQQTRVQLQQMAETRNPNAAIPKKITPPGLIRALRPEITAILKQGYDVDDIVAVLSNQGILLNARTFREYWRAVKRKRTRRHNVH